MPGRHFHAQGGNPSRTYTSWALMKGRCLNPNGDKFRLYGGRGIDLDPRWMSFDVFLADMGERPAGKSLDRINPERGYWPDNCRWATQKEQVRNRRCSILVKFGGRDWAVADLAKHLGVARTTLGSRIAKGWPDEMLGAPADKANRAA